MSSISHAAVVPGTILGKQNDPAPGYAGSTLATVGTPFTTQSGRVGFLGTLGGALTTGYVWYDGAVVWHNGLSVSPVLTGMETSSMGVGSAGGCGPGFYAFSCSIDGDDGIWTSNGFLIKDGDAAPGAPGKFISFASRPCVYGPSTVGFIAGLSNTSGGATAGRAFYTCDLSGSPSYTLHLQTGDSVTEGVDSYPLGVNPGPDISFEHDVSDNLLHRVQIVRANYPAGNTASRQVVIRNNQVLLKVGDQPVNGFPLTQYTQFQVVSVNNAGEVLAAGLAGGSGVLVWNGSVILKDGDPLASVPNIFAIRVVAAGVTNSGEIGAVIDFQDINALMTRAIVRGSLSQPTSSWTIVARTADQVDTTGDSVGDFDLEEIAVPLHRSMDIADGASFPVEVRLRNIATLEQTWAVVDFGLPGGASDCDAIDFNNDGVAPDTGDIDDFLSVFGGGPCSNDPNCNDVDFNNDGVAPDTGDIDAFLRVFGGGPCCV